MIIQNSLYFMSSFVECPRQQIHMCMHVFLNKIQIKTDFQQKHISNKLTSTNTHIHKQTTTIHDNHHIYNYIEALMHRKKLFEEKQHEL